MGYRRGMEICRNMGDTRERIKSGVSNLETIFQESENHPKTMERTRPRDKEHRVYRVGRMAGSRDGREGKKDMIRNVHRKVKSRGDLEQAFSERNKRKLGPAQAEEKWEGCGAFRGAANC